MPLHGTDKLRALLLPNESVQAAPSWDHAVQAATPAEPKFGGLTAAAKALPELALRLVTGLAAGATAATFRAAVAELPPALKQRLQVRCTVDTETRTVAADKDAILVVVKSLCTGGHNQVWHCRWHSRRRRHGVGLPAALRAQRTSPRLRSRALALCRHATKAAWDQNLHGCPEAAQRVRHEAAAIHSGCACVFSQLNSRFAVLHIVTRAP